ncbi:MAG TPA: fumarylacetoacetate hydrolase family protein [Casimicrobiaceae bacterium]|nr:fumarylacetoacetate hydrolase family protein [Casimicrobiaceae bacterium]
MPDLESAARLLLQARETRQPIEALPQSMRPRNEIEAYAVQNAQMRSLGTIGGWKVGARSPTASPNAGPLPQSLVFASPHRFEERFRICLIEAEIGFTVGRDLPPRSGGYEVDEVVDAMASVHSTIEVVESRYRNRVEVDWPSLVADFLGNGALVVGPPRTHDLRVDQTLAHVRVYCNDALDYEATGGNAAGDVLRLLGWLANHAADRVGGLRAGQVVTTGSCVGVRQMPPGARVRAEFDGLPPVEMTF